MAMFYVLGTAFVTEEELRGRQSSIRDFNEMFRKDRNRAKVDFSTGTLRGDNIMEGEKITPFKPIKIGLPLTIEIRHVYTGKFPEPGWGGKEKDMLVTSAMKHNIGAIDASPRAINILEKKVLPKYSTDGLSVTTKGTPLVYYSPALIEKNSVLKLEVGFDDFPKEFFDAISNVLIQASGIPIFMAANSYLVAGGIIAKLAGDIGERLFEKPPVLGAKEKIFFERSGESIPIADFRVVTNDNSIDEDLLKQLKFDVNKGLVDEAGRPYDGDEPYMVISLDGGKNEEYKGFTPTVASTALIEKFYGIVQDEQKKPLDLFIDAAQLYSDFSLRCRADDLEEKLKNPNSDDYEKTKQLYNALRENIKNKDLKPKAI